MWDIFNIAFEEEMEFWKAETPQELVQAISKCNSRKGAQENIKEYYVNDKRIEGKNERLGEIKGQV